ncbi:hypothetical protein ABEO79_00195 [Micromonospora provocatoris]
MWHPICDLFNSDNEKGGTEIMNKVVVNTTVAGWIEVVKNLDTHMQIPFLLNELAKNDFLLSEQLQNENITFEQLEQAIYSGYEVEHEFEVGDVISFICEGIRYFRVVIKVDSHDLWFENGGCWGKGLCKYVFSINNDTVKNMLKELSNDL